MVIIIMIMIIWFCIFASVTEKARFCATTHHGWASESAKCLTQMGYDVSATLYGGVRAPGRYFVREVASTFVHFIYIYMYIFDTMRSFLVIHPRNQAYLCQSDVSSRITKVRQYDWVIGWWLRIWWMYICFVCCSSSRVSCSPGTCSEIFTWVCVYAFYRLIDFSPSSVLVCRGLIL